MNNQASSAPGSRNRRQSKQENDLGRDSAHSTVASVATFDQSASMEFKSAELTPQFIEQQRQKAEELEERQRVNDQAVAPATLRTSESTAASTTSQEAAAAMPSELRESQELKPPPLIGAISVSGNESKLLPRRTKSSNSLTEGGFDENEDMKMSPRLPENYSSQNVSAYWKQRFQRESDNSSTTAIHSEKGSSDDLKPRPTFAALPYPEEPSSEFAIVDEEDVEGGPRGRLSVESKASSLRTSTNSSVGAFCAVNASQRSSSISHASASITVNSLTSAMRSEDETYDETATFDNGGDHAAMPQNLESEHQRDHSPVPNPSGGRRRSMRRSFLGQLGLVEAQKVDDAEPVFYA